MTPTCLASEFMISAIAPPAFSWEAGTHPKVVQDLLGHSTIQLTLDTYSH